MIPNTTILTESERNDLKSLIDSLHRIYGDTPPTNPIEALSTLLVLNMDDPDHPVMQLYKNKPNAVLFWFMTEFQQQPFHVDLPLAETTSTISVSLNPYSPNLNDGTAVVDVCYKEGVEDNLIDLFVIDQFSPNKDEKKPLNVYFWGNVADEDFTAKLKIDNQPVETTDDIDNYLTNL